MPFDYIPSGAGQTDQCQTLHATLKHVLGDSTNTSSEHESSRTPLGDRIHRLQKAAVIRQYQQEIQRKLQLIEDSSASKRIKIDTDIVDEITRYQQESTDRETAKSRRELYNMQHTSLIPLIMDDEFVSLLNSSLVGGDQLSQDLLTLLNSMDTASLREHQ
ncbi:unnamed protein product [Adineta ricciae]|uniref:Uncharacterized protein n=1 Tax=Adineta ricciae TaxID=249248 RepID=A0A813TPB5_ADIRI|nr:unnamed protein product [Adineta ricciae]CAF0844848.1 unnamed protein product [Adineta ricciae]